MKLLTIIFKNFKILFRSKTSAFVVLLGPLLIIALISLALSNTEEFQINVGIIAQDNEGMTQQFISHLESGNYKLINYSTIDECTEEIRLQTTHLCISFPENFKIDNSDEIKEVQFYADKTRINLVESIVSSVKSTITVKSDEISLGFTENILETINVTSNEVAKQKLILEEIKEKASGSEKNIEKIKSNSEEISKNLESSKNELKNVNSHNDEIESSMNNLKTKTETLLTDLDKLLDTLEDSGTASSSTSKVRTDYNAVNDILETETNDIKEGNDALKNIVDNVDETINSASNYDIKTFANNANTEMSVISEKIIEIENKIKTIENKISLLEVTSAENIINPFSIKVNSIASTSERSTFMFPYFVTLIILFVGIMLSSTLIVMEKQSRAFFRTFTTPTREVYHIIANIITNMIVILLQLGLIVIGAIYYLKIPALNNYPVTLVILILSLLFFIMLGILLGYIFKTQEGTNIGSISIGSISIFLSNLILPVESFPEIVRKMLMFNPFMLCSELFKKSMLFSASFKVLQNQLILLGSYLVVITILVIIFYMISLNKFLSVISNNKILKRTHFTNDNCLRLQDGTLLKNKNDLLHALKDMQEDEYIQFVHNHHNEFALWIKDSFKDKKLARKIKKAKIKDKIIEVLKEDIKEEIEKNKKG
jgi:ABC-2 type transport system permease protein